MSTEKSVQDQEKRAALIRQLQLRALKQTAAPETRRTQIVQADRSQPLRLSWAQQRLWFLDQLDPQASSAYHIPLGLYLSGKLDLAALRASLDSLVHRHENLRTRFVQHSGQDEAVQEFAAPDCGFALSESDLRHLHGADQEAAVQQHQKNVFSRPFDLAQGPLLRGSLLRLQDEEHLLLLNQHHIISDAWSMGVLVQELATLYTAISQARPNPLPALSLHYADYAQWQRQYLQGTVLQEQQEYWRQQLAGAPELLSLPLDFPRPALQDYAGASWDFALPVALSQALRQFSQRHGTTLFMSLLASWALLLSRMAGQSEVVIGSPVANRQRSEIENMTGFFVNTVALKINLAQVGLADYLAQVKHTTLQAFAHQELPFEQVVEALKPQRSLRHSPIFQTMLNLQSSQSSLQLPGLRVRNLALSRDTSHFDLSLNVADDGQQLHASLEYASALFAQDSMQRLASYWQTLLQAMLSAEDHAPIAQLHLLSPAQRAQLSQEFNQHDATPSSFSDLIDESIQESSTLHQLFEAQVARQPEAMAVVLGEQKLSYQELNQRANQLAHYLLQQGLQANSLVAVCLERRPNMLVAVLAILKAGAAYVPLDPSSPQQRLEYMLADSQAAHLISDSAIAAGLTHTCHAVLLDDASLEAALATQPLENPELGDTQEIAAHRLAYVIYTSGSTGAPKGVMIEHRNVINLLRHQLKATGLQAHDRVLQFASLAFDASVGEIFPALAAGACLFLRPAQLLIPDQEFADFLQKQRISVLDLPTAFWHLWTQELAQGRSLPGPDLRSLAIGGEKAELRHLAQWLACPATAHCHLHNTYGPTEATVHTITQTLRTLPAHEVAIGRPIAGTQVYLFDAAMQLVPIGVAGEIYIAGAGLARGYLHRPELTAERFIDYQNEQGQTLRLYKTGDLARWMADGSLEYLGRNDFQVKLRGYRIELGEIEARLVACPGVREAVVLARQDAHGETRLIAYLTGTVLDAQTLRGQLSQHLADYMLPAAFVHLPALPVNQNGKLDRQALPEPDLQAMATQAYRAPQGHDEVLVAEIWQSLLHLPQVGRDDNFFALGGHSLLAVQLISRLRLALGREVPLRSLFEFPTLSDFAAQLGTAQHSRMQAIPHADRSQPLPLSWAQQRLWFLAELEGAAGSAAYHMPVGLRLRGTLHHAALRASFTALWQRHENLRASFVMPLGQAQAQQVFAPEDSEFALQEHDLRHHDDLDAALAAIRAEVMERPFDLARGPLLRASLLRLQDDEHLLLINQHHIISDAWSMQLLVKEVSQLYAAFSQGLPNPLAPLALQYADYALWQRQWLQGETLQQQVAFWRQQLAGAPELLALPSDRPRPALQNYAGKNLDFQLSPELSTGLRQLSQRHGSTLFMTLLAAWALLLSRMSAQSEVVIGSPVANRQRSEVEQLSGFFVNTLALRVNLGSASTLTELLAQVKNTTLAAYAHQDLPFEQVVEALKPQRSLNHSPLFQSMLSLASAGQEDSLSLPGLDIEALPQTRKVTQFDTSISLVDDPVQISGNLEYASQLYDDASMLRLLDYWQTLLQAMVADVALPLAQLPLLNAAQQKQLLLDFNATASPRGSATTLHQLFEAQAAAQAQACALLFDGAHMTYGELNQRANQLAHHLLALGVQPDARVAICLERSFAMIIAMLAVLKAGAAYVPLDPGHPNQRLHYMLDDSGAQIALCSSTLSLRLTSDEASKAPTHRHNLLLDDANLIAQLAALPAHNPVVPTLHSQHLAYVIYTSGSTGAPKGVMLEHASVLNLVHYQIKVSQMHSADRVLQFASFGFDNSVAEIFPCLGVGAQLVLRPPSMMIPDQEFVDFLAQQQITVLDLPTAFWHLWAQEIRAGRSVPWSGLRWVAAGGEKAELRHLTSWLACPALRDCQWLNTYGPTEATVNALSMQYNCHSALPLLDIPIGRPIANTEIYLLDGAMQLVPIGVAGEIHIGGAGLARGYLNRASLTAERFIQYQRPDGVQVRLYKTGDLGRWLADGSVEYLGRNDFQVKLRGYRIELGEIEACLVACPGVQEAVVLARQDAQGETRLIAYITGEPQDALHLRSQLSQHLADYMLPAAFVHLAALPVNQNGKLDRPALPEPDSKAMASSVFRAPEGRFEIAVADIWQDLLQVAQVGRDDDFFALGGHSLLAVQLISRLRLALAVEVPLRSLFAAPKLLDFAGQLQTANASTQDAIAVADRSHALPLSWAQQRLWFLQQLDQQHAVQQGNSISSASSAYHIPFGLRLTGQLDVAALQASVQALWQRHEILRTNFVLVAGASEAQQVIAEATSNFALAQYDLCALDNVQEVLAQHIAQVMHTPFDLAQEPLIRVALLRTQSDEHLLLINQHHIISDGWSIQLLVQELAQLYSAFKQGQSNPLAPLTLQYADYAVWQRQSLQGAALQQQVAYWRKQLTGAPSLLNLHTDYPRPAIQNHAGGSLDFTLNATITAGLRQLSARHGTTLFMTLLAAWACLLARMSGQAEIVIGSPVANRQRREIEQVCGFFVNTLALRVDVGAAPSFAALLAQVKTCTLDAYAHQDLPFEQVVEALQPERSLSHSPLFQSMLILNSQSSLSALELPGLQISEIQQENRSTQFDTVLALNETAQELIGSLEYASQLFSAASMQNLLTHFTCWLESMLANAEAALPELNLLSSQQRQHLLQLGENPADAGATPLLHQLFEAQVRKQGEAIALQYGEVCISYAELNQRANLLAHHLLRLQVLPDARIAVCMERGIEMVVGLLAILKAGAAYVPLDPALPAARKAFMLQDSAPMLLLTEASLSDALQALLSTQVKPLPILCLDSDWPQITAQALGAHSANPEASALGLTAQHLAYLMYTSGSTGQPKGVMNQHDGVVSQLLWGKQTFNIGPDDVLLQKTPFSFDVSVWEIFFALQCGSRLVIARPQGHMDVDYLIETIRQHNISSIQFVPSLLALFLQHPEVAQCTSLRHILAAGEALAPQVAQRCTRLLPDCALHNLYGPTEAAVYATHWHCPSGELPRMLLGKPIAHTRVYLLDETMQAVPLGVAGHLHLGGVCVARGYFQQEALTQERFIADPFTQQQGARLYKTGDLARWLPNGELEYLGRNDFQVKLRGQRIELAEIENALLACAGVQEAVVLLREEQAGDQRLHAYLVAQPDHMLSLATVQQSLAERLASYMLPASYQVLTALPLTPNGKLDRLALPVPDNKPGGNSLAGESLYHAPLGATEIKLAQLWQALLQCAPPSRDDNFFALGGHSLLALRLVAATGEQFARKLTLHEVFAHATLAAQAKLLASDAASNSNNLLALRMTGSARPLLLIHSGGGEVAYAQHLLAALDEEIPVYGLVASGHGEDETPLTDISAMASRYLACIAQAQIAGPYRLLGYSGGGTVAYEMARQLLAQGEQVEFIGMIDSQCHYHATAVLNEAQELWEWFAEHSKIAPQRSFASDSDAQQAAQALRHLQQLAQQQEVDAMLDFGLQQALFPAQISHAWLRRHIALRYAMWQALCAYRLEWDAQLRCPLTLFSAQEAGSAENVAHWHSAIGAALQVLTIGGTHASIVTPPLVQQLVATLNTQLLQHGSQGLADFPERMKKLA